jgi:hypothetical protein
MQGCTVSSEQNRRQELHSVILTDYAILKLSGEDKSLRLLCYFGDFLTMPSRKLWCTEAAHHNFRDGIQIITTGS